MSRDYLSHCQRCGKALPPPNKFCAATLCSGACRTAAYRHRMLHSATGAPDEGVTLGPWTTSLESLVEAVAVGEIQPFGCIYADPPWHYDNTGTRGAASHHYETMTLDEIAALLVEKLVAEQALLWLWVTNTHLLDVKPIITAWGFAYKTNRAWDKESIGLGNYLRNQHELLLLCSRGGQTTLTTNTSSVIQAKRRGHSVKPKIIRDDVARNSPAPRLELFARGRAVG